MQLWDRRRVKARDILCGIIHIYRKIPDTNCYTGLYQGFCVLFYLREGKVRMDQKLKCWPEPAVHVPGSAVRNAPHSKSGWHTYCVSVCHTRS